MNFFTRAITAPAALVAAAGLANTVVAQNAPTLNVGDPAPPLEDVVWLAGDPAPSYEEGQIYVLDFWATWCGPCIQSMPHLRELQEQYEDEGVHVIGVAIWPRSRGTTPAQFIANPPNFVGEITWSIAEDIERQTADAYMKAAGKSGIPTAMVVDRSGKLAWMGHPMALDEPLAQIVSGEFSIEAELLKGEIQKSAAARDWEKVVSQIDELIDLQPSAAKDWGPSKYVILANYIGNKDKASEWGQELASKHLKDDAQGLSNLAWKIADPKTSTPAEDRDLDLAMEASSRAVELSERQNADFLDTLARVYAWHNEFDKAIGAQEEAIALTTDKATRDIYMTSLAEYVAAESGS